MGLHQHLVVVLQGVMSQQKLSVSSILVEWGMLYVLFGRNDDDCLLAASVSVGRGGSPQVLLYIL